MKIQLEVGIYGFPTKLNLVAKLLYGKKEKNESKIFRKEFSLDDGGKVILPMSFFQDFLKTGNYTDDGDI